VARAVGKDGACGASYDACASVSYREALFRVDSNRERGAYEIGANREERGASARAKM